MKNKILIFVYSKHQISKVLNIFKKNKRIKLVALNEEISGIFEKLDIPFVNSIKYREKGNLERDYIGWLKDFANKKLRKHKSIKEMFIYKGFSLWWLMEHWLHFSIRYFPFLMGFFAKINLITNILSLEKPNKLISIECGDFFDYILRNISGNISLKVIKSRRGLFATSLKEKIDMFWADTLFLLAISRIIIRKLVWSFLKILFKQPPKKIKNKVVLFFCPSAIKEELKKQKDLNLLFIDQPLNFNIGIKRLYKEIRCKDEVYQALENWFAFKDVFKVWEIKKTFSRQWNKLKKTKEYNESIKFRGVSLHKIFNRKLSFFFSKYLLEILLSIEAINNLIRKERPNLVFLSGEATFFGRRVVAMSKLNGVPVLGMQHGHWAEITLEYIHNKNEISPKGKSSMSYCPLPDKTAVFGEHYKKYLIQKGNYKPNWIEITGNPKWDSLYNADKLYSKDAICKELGLDPNKNIIVLATQPMLFPEEGAKIVYTACNAIKRLPNVQLIIKLHPMEISDSIHRKIAKESGVNNVIFLRTYPIFKILYICDIFLTSISTTLIEASILDKPVVTIDVYNKGYVDYLDKNVVLAAHSSEELLTNLRKILYDGGFCRNLKRARELFVYNHCYTVDGKASNRVRNLIETMLKRKKTKF